MGAEPQRLHVAFFPFMAAGHMIPTLDIAKLFAAHHVKVTIITTPKNAPFFTKPLETCKIIGPPIEVEIIPFASQEAGLPDGIENFDEFNSMDLTIKFLKATNILQDSLENVIKKCKPNCLVADMLFPYATDVAAKFNIPRLVFHGTNCFSQCVTQAMLKYEPFKSDLLGDNDEFIIPNLPHEIKQTKKQLPEIMRGEVEEELAKEWKQIFGEAIKGEEKSYGVIINTFYELEPDYVDYYKNVMGRKAWHIGPVSLCNRENDAKFQRGKDSSIDEHECLKWLDSKKPKSVVYVCFGSLADVSSSQLHEIALGLEASEQDFIWVVRRSNKDGEDWVPHGFEKRVEGKGLIIRGWAPQVLILDHEAIGAFVTHCGWNSTLEAISLGVPLMAMPQWADQPTNAKYIAEVWKIGVRSKVNDKGIITREELNACILEVMEGESAREIKANVLQWKKVLHEAMQEGGTSDKNIQEFVAKVTNM